MKRRGGRATIDGHEDGSALVLVLFACLVVAAILQALFSILVCAERAIVDESVGRSRLNEKDGALAELRTRGLRSWEQSDWESCGAGSSELEGRTTTIPGFADWALSAEVRGTSGVELSVSARLERGRDGIDLPLAALVAGELIGDPARDSPLVDLDADTTSAGGSLHVLVHTAETPPPGSLGRSCTAMPLESPWELDQGWRDLVVKCLGVGSSQSEAHDLAPLDEVVLAEGERGRWVTMPLGALGSTSEEPRLVVVTGGAGVDARDMGDFYGILVVDGGSLLIDGTTVHGAVFVTEEVDLGSSGLLLYSSETLRWTTDRSFRRVRLVPGTRREALGMAPHGILAP